MSTWQGKFDWNEERNFCGKHRSSLHQNLFHIIEMDWVVNIIFVHIHLKISLVKQIGRDPDGTLFLYQQIDEADKNSHKMVVEAEKFHALTEIPKGMTQVLFNGGVAS